jgi:hypothetical protein
MIYGKMHPRPGVPTSSIHNTDGHRRSSGMNTIKEKMNEADTFNALKRIPYNQIYAIWKDTLFGNNWQIFYTQYGWTYDEFWTEYTKRENERR